MALFAPHIITPDSALGGSVIERSLRFRGSQYLNRSPSGDGNRRTFTLSLWIKRGDIGEHYILDAFQDDSNRTRIGIEAGNGMQVTNRVGGSTTQLTSSQKLRDFNGWYHLVFAIDTTQATSSNRIKYYVNGVLDTNVSGTYPSQNDVTFVNHSGDNHTIGVGQDSGGLEQYFEGYMAEMHLIDGVQLDASYFGYTESQTGIWRPKRYTYGNYGTHGFHLDFSDNSSTAALGIDKSGNSNNFTPNNFSVTAGVTNDSMIDTPTNNWCVWNGLTDVSDITLNNGALQGVSGADSWPAIFGTHGASSGKWYYEAVGADNTRWGLGWSTEDFKTGTSNTFSVGHFAYSQDPLTFYQDGSNVAINGTPAFTTGNVLQIAIDIDAGKTWFGINNTWVNASNGSAGDPAAGTNPTITFSEKGQKHYPKMINNLGDVSVNFGQQGFTYTPPDGFQALNSINLATANRTGVIRPQRFFDTILYTGNGSSPRTIGGLEFKPDFVWLKHRNGTSWHRLQNSVVGANKLLYSNSTNAEATDEVNGHLNSFTSDGFIIDDPNADGLNNNGGTYVAWCWKAGGTAVSNSDGDITSSVSANTEAGFSIVTYTGNGSGTGQTVGHGLGKAPKVIFLKKRNAATNWFVYHGAAGDGAFEGLNTTSAYGSGLAPFNTTAPSSTVVTLGNTDGNQSGINFVLYCWAEIPGYSKFGSYEGNTYSSGPYVHLGFRPAWIMIKNMDNSSNRHWVIIDSTRSTINKSDSAEVLFADDNQVESYANNNYGQFGSKPCVDFLSNGFKIREADTSGVYTQTNRDMTHVYMAFAEQPTGTIFGLDANAR